MRAGWWSERHCDRWSVLTTQAALISSLETDRRLPPVPGDDEIARLARTLDAMLDRLAATFARERAFVDDASHELRGPIAVLRGELELALSAIGESAEVERSLRAALGETERLARLAEDLLLLARERAGLLVVRREPVDLLDLAADEARRLGPTLGAPDRRVRRPGGGVGRLRSATPSARQPRAQQRHRRRDRSSGADPRWTAGRPASRSPTTGPGFPPS